MYLIRYVSGGKLWIDHDSSTVSDNLVPLGIAHYAFAVTRLYETTLR